MKRIALIAAVVISGCATVRTAEVPDLAQVAQADAATAARIAHEWGDQVGAACFDALASHQVITPAGPLSALAAARAVRIGRPLACDRVLSEARQRATSLGL